jgi:hypothetical protein
MEKSRSMKKDATLAFVHKKSIMLGAPGRFESLLEPQD